MNAILSASADGTDDAEPGLIDAVLLHELCHIRRRDYAWNLLLRVVQSLYWPHPLVWVASRVIEGVREQVCDQLCVHWITGRPGYRAVLVAVATAMARRPGPALGLAIVRTTRLERRLARIEQTRGTSRCVLRRPVRLAVGIAFGLSVGLLGAVELSRATVAPRTDLEPVPLHTTNFQQSQPVATDYLVKTFEFLTLDDATGEPLSGVTVRVTYFDEQHLILTTDRQGHAKVPRPESDYGVDPGFRYSISFWKDGYVQDFTRWSDYARGYSPIPERFAVRLKRGVMRIGGTVRDEAGKAIAGATVSLSESGTKRKAGTGMLSNLPVTTDAEGRWTTGSVPPEPGRIFGWVTHPEFLRGVVNAPLDAMVAGKADVVLKPGEVIEGRILDDVGKPLAGASIVAAASRDVSSDRPQSVSDVDGRFRMANVEPGIKSVVVSAPGRMPELRAVQASRGMSPLEIRLRPGKALRGRVVDENGKPIAGAHVSIGDWRNVRVRLWSTRTGAEGRFVWDSAPDDEVTIYAARPGYSGDGHGVTADEREKVWTLSESMHIHGTVTDAKSGKRIHRFELATTPDVLEKRPPPAISPPPRIFGQYNLRVKRPVDDFNITMIAQGYRTHTSRKFGAGDKDVVYDVKLERLAPGEGGGPTGTILGLDGKALAGAVVQLGILTRPTTLRNGAAYEPGTSFFSGLGFDTTADDGTFTFHPVDERFSLAVIHDSGYAELMSEELAKSGTIQVRPWGPIVGQVSPDLLKEGDQITVVRSTLFNRDFVVIGSQYEGVKVGSDGRFVVEHVTPGHLAVGLNSNRPGPRFRVGGPSRVEVKPGETANVILQPRGRTVIGTLRPLPDDGVDLTRFTPDQPYSPSLSDGTPEIPFPIDLLKERDRAQLESWARAWSESPEGIAYRSSHRGGNVRYELPGTFRAESILPGDYYLTIRLLDPQSPTVGHQAIAWKRVTVPDGPVGSTFDLGSIPVRRLAHPTVGEVAPPIVATKLDGKPFQLDVLRGKFVVLYFWRSDHTGSREQLADLEAVRRKFGDDPRVVVVGLNLDVDRDVARKFVVEAGQPWIQVALGDWPDTAIPASYGVQALTTTVIVGPDGKILLTLPADASLVAELTKLLDRK
jgi:hypothetical protein